MYRMALLDEIFEAQSSLCSFMYKSKFDSKFQATEKKVAVCHENFCLAITVLELLRR